MPAQPISSSHGILGIQMSTLFDCLAVLSIVTYYSTSASNLLNMNINFYSLQVLSPNDSDQTELPRVYLINVRPTLSQQNSCAL